MNRKNLALRMWFFMGILSATTFGAFANLPRSGDLSGSMAPTQDVSEIRVKRQADLSFDQDLKQLSSLQGRYRENLPLLKRKVKSHPLPSRQSAASPRIRAKIGQR